MAALSIRNLDDDVKQRLRERAAAHGRSMEAEIRTILEEAVTPEEEPDNPFLEFHRRFQEIGGVELELPERNDPVRPVDLS